MGRPVPAAELEHRPPAVVAARHSIEMEGGRVSDAAASDLDGYAAREWTVGAGFDRASTDLASCYLASTAGEQRRCDHPWRSLPEA